MTDFQTLHVEREKDFPYTRFRIGDRVSASARLLKSDGADYLVGVYDAQAVIVETLLVDQRNLPEIVCRQKKSRGDRVWRESGGSGFNASERRAWFVKPSLDSEAEPVLVLDMHLELIEPAA